MPSVRQFEAFRNRELTASVEWGFDGAKAQEYVTAVTGSPFPKSACSYCCFAMATETGRANQVERYRREPQVSVLADVGAFSLNLG